MRDDIVESEHHADRGPQCTETHAGVQEAAETVAIEAPL
jgi:hypothetical protein